MTLERDVKMLKKKKYVEINRTKGGSRVRDKRLVLMQERICDPGLTLKQRQLILHEVGKWSG